MIPGKSADDRLQTSWSLFWPYFAVVLSAYGFTMFNLTLASDEWLSVQQTDPFYWVTIMQGRWLAKLIWKIADDISFAPSFTLVVLCAAYFLFSLVSSWSLGLKRRGSILIFACVAVCFPINSEPFSFKMAHLIFAFALGFATVSGFAMIRAAQLLYDGKAAQAAIYGLAAALLFMLSASLYQPFALFTCAIVLMNVVGIARAGTDLDFSFSRISLLLACACAAVVAGLVFYFISVRVASFVDGVPLVEGNRYSVRNSLVDTWSQLFLGVRQGLSVLYDLVFAGNTLFPKITKITFLVAAVGLVWGFAFDWDENGERARGKVAPLQKRMIRVGILSATVLLLFLLPLALGMLQKIPLYRYNNLVGIALPHAMVYALLYETARDIYWRGAVTLLVIAVVGIFAFEQNRSSVTTFLLNRRDLAIASRMLERITANPAFAPFAEKKQAWIVFYGDQLEDRLLPRPFSVDGRRDARYVKRTDVDCGLFNCQKMIRAEYAFRLIGESRFTYRTSVWPNLPAAVTPEEKERLLARIKGAHPWPAPDSVIFGDNIIVVMLKPPG